MVGLEICLTLLFQDTHGSITTRLLRLVFATNVAGTPLINNKTLLPGGIMEPMGTLNDTIVAQNTFRALTEIVVTFGLIPIIIGIRAVLDILLNLQESIAALDTPHTPRENQIVVNTPLNPREEIPTINTLAGIIGLG